MERNRYELEPALDHDLAADPNRLQSRDSTNYDALDHSLDTISTKPMNHRKPFSAEDGKKLEATFRGNNGRLPGTVLSQLAREMDRKTSGIKSCFRKRRKEAEDNSRR